MDTRAKTQLNLQYVNEQEARVQEGKIEVEALKKQQQLERTEFEGVTQEYFDELQYGPAPTNHAISNDLVRIEGERYSVSVGPTT